MTSKPNTTTLTSGPRASRGVFTRSKEQGFAYRDSLGLVPSHSHSKQAFVYSDPSVSVSGHSTSSIEDTRSSIIDDQQSTEPVPLELDYKSNFVSSPPPLTLQDAPVTRARARTQARSHFTDGSASPSLKPESPRTNPDDNEYNLPESGNDDGGDDDDEYQLSESDDIHDNSEMSVINEIIGRKKKISKKPVKAKYSSRPKGKQAAKEKAVPIKTKKVSRPATKRTTAPTHKRLILPKQAPDRLAKNNASQDELSPVHQAMENPERGHDQEVSDVISDSQCTSQGFLSPQEPRSRGPNSRRPKRPFYPGNLQQAKPQPAQSAHSTISIHQQPTTRQGNTISSSPDKTELRGDRAIPTNPIRHNAIDSPQPESSRRRGKNGAKFPVGKGNDHSVSHSQPIVTAHEVNNSPIRVPFDRHSQPNVGMYQSLQGSPSYRMEAETSKRPDDSEPSKQPAKKVKLEPVIRQSPNNADASTQPGLPQPSSSPTHYLRMRRTKNEATQTEIFDEPLSRDLYHQERQKQGEEEGQQQRRQEMIGNNTTSRFLRSPQAHAISGLPWEELATTEARKAGQRAEKLDHPPSLKASKCLLDTEESLHPSSIAWAQRISERSRQKKLVSTLPAISEETPPPRQTRITKPETVVAGARDAVSESLQEMATGLFQHLKSKEFVSNTIVDSYQRNGRKLVDRLLDHQSSEIRRYVAAFDRKCVRLANMYDEAARLVGASSEKSLRQNEEYDRVWQERKKENDEEIIRVWEAVASLKSLRRRA